MKIVVKQNNNIIVTPDKTSNEKYYGVRFANKLRGFISRDFYNHGDYTVKSLLGATNGNGWGHYSSHKLDELIYKLLDCLYCVYEFDDHKELGKWLLEDE